MTQTTITPPPPYALHSVAARHHFLLRRLHSLTGILFGSYIVLHLSINATLAQGMGESGTWVYQTQVDKIYALPFLQVIEWVFIYIPLLFHMIYGGWIIVTGQPNVGAYGYAKNWAYLMQRVTAAILVLFIAFHVLGFKGFLGESLRFHPFGYAAQSTINHLHAAWWVGYVVYPIGILAATFHLANGFWAAGITWGLTISATAQRRWGWVCVGIFVFTFACAMTALIAGLANPVTPLQ